MNVNEEMIGLEKAADYLRTNEENRNLRANVVKRYAADMRSGQWKSNGQPVVFDEGGRLIDGQHRLTAVIESGVPTEFLVVRGVRRTHRDTIDSGLGRKISDRLAFDGHKNTTVLSSRATVLLSMEHGSASRYKGPSIGQIKDVIKRHSEALGWANSEFPNGHGFGHSSVVGALAYCWPKNKDITQVYADRLRDGENLARGNPVYAMREYIIASSERQRDMSLVLSAGVLRTLYAFIHGERVHQIKPKVVLDGDWWPRLIEFFKA